MRRPARAPAPDKRTCPNVGGVGCSWGLGTPGGAQSRHRLRPWLPTRWQSPRPRAWDWPPRDPHGPSPPPPCSLVRSAVTSSVFPQKSPQPTAAGHDPDPTLLQRGFSTPAPDAPAPPPPPHRAQAGALLRLLCLGSLPWLWTPPGAQRSAGSLNPRPASHHGLHSCNPVGSLPWEPRTHPTSRTSTIHSPLRLQRSPIILSCRQRAPVGTGSGSS